MNRNEIESLLSSYDRAVHGGDLASARACMHPDATVAVMGEAPRGFEQHLEFLSTFNRAFSDQHSSHSDVTIEGDRVASRWTWEATHSAEFFGIPATGKRVRMSGLAMMTVRDGRIARVTGEGDMRGLMQQIGAAPPT